MKEDVWVLLLVSQASPFAPRGRVWSIAIEQLVLHAEYTVVQSYLYP